MRACKQPEDLVFTAADLPARFAEHGDLLAPLLVDPQRLPRSGRSTTRLNRRILADPRGRRHDPPVHPYLAGPRPRAYAHRGWHIGDLAGCENTIAAFRRAVDEGFGYLELDVHASADGVAVVHHDAPLDRTTDGTGPLAAHTAAELDEGAGARAGSRPAAGRRCWPRCPTPGSRSSSSPAPPSRRRWPCWSAADAWDRVCLGGVRARPGSTRPAAAAGERLCTSMATAGTRSACARGPGWTPCPARCRRAARRLPLAGDIAQLPVTAGPLRVVDAALLRTAHASGREVHVWTVDRPEQMRELLDLGVDGLLSDRPDLLREVLRGRGQWPGCGRPRVPHRWATAAGCSAWGLWDWGSSAYNAVILTFVFSVYLTDAVGEDLPGPIDANSWLGYAIGAAGLLIALPRRCSASGPTRRDGASARPACGPR